MNTKLVAIMAIAVMASFGFLSQSAEAELANGVTYSTGVAVDGTTGLLTVYYDDSLHKVGVFTISDPQVYNGNTVVFPTSTNSDGLGDNKQWTSLNAAETYIMTSQLKDDGTGSLGPILKEYINISSIADAADLEAAQQEVEFVTIVSSSSTSVTISNIGSHTEVTSAQGNVMVEGENSGFTALSTQSFTAISTFGTQSATKTITVDLVKNAAELQADIDAVQDAANLLLAEAERDLVTITSISSTSVEAHNVGSNTSITVQAFGGITMANPIFSGLTQFGTYDFDVSTTIGGQTATKTLTVTLVNNAAELQAVQDAADLAQAQADRDAVTHSFTSNSVTFSNIASSVTVTFGVSTMSDGETVSGLTEESSYTYTVSATVGTQTSSTNTISFTTPVSQNTVDSRNLAVAEAERDAVTHNARNAFTGASVVTFSNIGTNTIVTFEGSTVSENFNYGVTGLQDYTYNVSTTISGQTATSTVSFTAVISSTQAQAQAEADLASIVITFSPDATTATFSNIPDTVTSLYSGVGIIEITITNGVAIATGLTEQTSYEVAVIGQLGVEVSKQFVTPQSDLNRQADFDAAELAAQAELVKVTLTATQGIGFTVSNTGSAIVTFNGEVLQDGQAVATGAGSFTVQVEVTVTIGTQSSTMSTEITVIVDEDKKKRKHIPSYPTNIVGININGMDINVDRHDIMLETPVKSFGLTTIQVSLDDPEGDMIGLRVYIEQPDFHDTGYSKANVYGAEIYVTGKHSEMTGYTIDNMETNDKNDFYWVSQDKDFKNLGKILSAEVLSVKLIERDVKTSNLIEGNFDVNKVVEIKMLNTFDMEGATIYVLANDRDSNMQMFKIYNALTVEHIGSQGFEDMNEGGCGKTGNHNNWTACVKNPYTYVR